MSNKFVVSFGNDIKIFDITKHERHAIFNALSNKDTTTPLLKEIIGVLRNNNVSSIYLIESDGETDDLAKYYDTSPNEFIYDVKIHGEKIYSR